MGIVVIGLGVTGYSVVEHLAPRADVVVLDTRADPPLLGRLREQYPEVTAHLSCERFDFRGVDRVIVSPGIALDHPLVAAARDTGAEILSDIDLFCANVEAPVVAITGTNGKSTVTALVGHLLGEGGTRVGVGGNLGEAALNLLDVPSDVFVLELSSFQLERVAVHPFRVAAVLNVTDDHLDRYPDFAAYARSKRSIYRAADAAVYNRQDVETRPERDLPSESVGLDVPHGDGWGVISDGRKRMLRGRGVDLIDARDLPLAGDHNVFNVLAALAVCSRMGRAPERLIERLASFRGLPHRCELVASIDGVDYVDDSKATNVGACEAALAGLGGGRAIVLIAGGMTKGVDLSVLKPAVRRYVRHLVLLGADTATLESQLATCVPMTVTRSMPAAVKAAHRAAAEGDLVLLSPACASFDLFESYVDRGEQFAAAVRELDA